MTPVIVPFYAALLTLLFIVLSKRVIQARRAARVAIGDGDGDNPRLRRAIAVHTNFAQYVPLALLLMTFVEMASAPYWLVHLLGLILLAGRGLHAYGVSQEKENFRLRRIAMLLTFAALAIAAVHLLTTTAIRLIVSD